MKAVHDVALTDDEADIDNQLTREIFVSSAYIASSILMCNVDCRAYRMMAAPEGAYKPSGNGSSPRCESCSSVISTLRPSMIWVGIQ